MSRMHNPPHPGEVFRGLYLEPNNITVTRAAQILHVTRKAVSDLVNGKSGVSPLMAKRISAAFGTDPEMWLRMQNGYDLWQLRNADMSQIESVDIENEVVGAS